MDGRASHGDRAVRSVGRIRQFCLLLVLARVCASRNEHDAYVQRVVHSRMRKPEGTQITSKSCAPFVSATDPYVDSLEFESVKPEAQDGTPAASFVQATWPISTDERLANSVSATAAEFYTPFRLSRWLRALDALTADVAYRHTHAKERGLVLVTASHYNSLKLMKTRSGRDVTIRSYVTATSSSSLEVRTDALQVDEQGNECLVNVCHTAMVALDRKTMRPCKGAVPPLVLPPPTHDSMDDEDEACAAHERAGLAALHRTQIAEERAAQMSTWARSSQPPTAEEMTAVHELHCAAVAAKGSPAPRVDLADEVSMHTHQSSVVVFPDNKNVHGLAFGGFVMSSAYDLAYLAARFFTRGAPFVPVGFDDATFVQPVSIGDMVRFTARVVHVGEDGVFRVFVTMDVIEPTDPGRLPQRTNNLMFVFAASPDPDRRRTVLPTTYPEVLMHVKASRNHARRGLSPTMRMDLAKFFSTEAHRKLPLDDPERPALTVGARYLEESEEIDGEAMTTTTTKVA